MAVSHPRQQSRADSFETWRLLDESAPVAALPLHANLTHHSSCVCTILTTSERNPRWCGIAVTPRIKDLRSRSLSRINRTSGRLPVWSYMTDPPANHKPAARTGGPAGSWRASVAPICRCRILMKCASCGPRTIAVSQICPCARRPKILEPKK